MTLTAAERDQLAAMTRLCNDLVAQRDDARARVVASYSLLRRLRKRGPANPDMWEWPEDARDIDEMVGDA